MIALLIWSLLIVFLAKVNANDPISPQQLQRVSEETLKSLVFSRHTFVKLSDLGKLFRSFRLRYHGIFPGKRLRLRCV